MTTNDPKEPHHRRRWGWLAALVVLLIAAGVGVAVLTDGGDSVDTASEQVKGAADAGRDAATNAGDDALDTATSKGADAVDGATSAAGDGLDTATSAADDARDAATSAADDGLDTVTNAGDNARDGVTNGNGESGAAAVQDDPVVKRLAKGRDLPFVAGPWARRSYRDSVFERLSDATKQRAEKVAQGDGFGIRIQ